MDISYENREIENTSRRKTDEIARDYSRIRVASIREGKFVGSYSRYWDYG